MSKITDLSKVVKFPISDDNVVIIKKYLYPTSHRVWLTVESGRVVRIIGLDRTITETIIRRHAAMWRVPEAEIHAAFIHQAEHFGAPIGDPMEGVFLRWRYRNSAYPQWACPRCRTARLAA